MEKEIWKDIAEFPNYQVSNLGRVRNKKTRHIIHQQERKNGYVKVELWQDGKQTTKDVHRLVALVFIDRPIGKTEVNHIDGNKKNNEASNLEWCTRKENMKHAIDTGLFAPKPPEPFSRRIRIVETGEIFGSAHECAVTIGSTHSNILNAISDKHPDHHSVKGLHFELVSEDEYRRYMNTKTKPFLRDYQMDAVKRMRNGCILNGGVGSGKSRTGLYYYFSQQGGSIENGRYVPMKNPKDLYIITTARKRDTLEWNQELIPFLMYPFEDPNERYYDNKIVIDSWNNIQKYQDIKGAYFILDEDKVTGKGAWVKAFLKIAKNNDWIILSATAGDTYMDYVPVFLANGFYKSRAEFNREHVQFARYVKYPKVERYYNTRKLERLRDRLLVEMDFDRHTVRHDEDIFVKYDIQKYKRIMRDRWNPWEDRPIKTAAELCYSLRRVVNEDEDRQRVLLELAERHPRMIIFYSYDYERDILLNLYYGEDVEVAEWTGHAHQPVPDSKKWIYLVQYTAGSDAWNCIKTDTIVFYSQTYSWKTLEQAHGRIDRMNTPYIDLYYYHIRSRSGIDLAITRALKNKKNFNERKFSDGKI